MELQPLPRPAPRRRVARATPPHGCPQSPVRPLPRGKTPARLRLQGPALARSQAHRRTRHRPLSRRRPQRRAARPARRRQDPPRHRAWRRLRAELGHRVYFVSAVEAARKLALALAENRLHRELKNFTRPKLLILDEVGYLALEPTQAALLFQVIAQRYDTGGSVVLTSNKPFAEWAHVFAGDAVMAGAALDRLLHKATVVNIRGDSYRLRERRRAGAKCDSLGGATDPLLTNPAPAAKPQPKD
ncbi:MAG: hypothetical protein C0502_11520 [Opitutus sp.]|nr:hypothetical protein [Opitutus sp.]